MASSEAEADGSQPTLLTALPEIDTRNKDLCDLCLQALTIDDKLAGGTTRVNASDGTTTLDLSGFAHNDWERDTVNGFREGRIFNERRSEDRDASGWVECDQEYVGLRKRTGQSRSLHARGGQERLVTLPGMLELSESAVGTCCFCAKLRDLFITHYSERSWWIEPGSTIPFTIQYEWSEYRSILDGEDEAVIPPSWQRLQGLAVLVDRPDLNNNRQVVADRPGLRRPKRMDVFQFDVVAWPGPCTEWLKIRTQPLDPDGPASGRNIGFMRRCIDECISNHPECKKKTTKPTFVPRRLLDLGTYKTDSARLIEPNLCSSNPETQLPYATLSYCWGQSLPMLTIRENKHEHETTGIEIRRMPAAFQDAIHVVKKLGIRHLWVDALCIIQDDKDDWEAEAVTMCDVFAHSQITVSAANTSSSAESFLQRPVEETLDLHFHSRLNPDIVGQYSIRLQPRHYLPAEHDLAQSTWSSRAWVWQEEVMSTRQVVFCNKALQFRCRKGVTLEDGQSQGSYGMSSVPSIHSWNNAMIEYSSRMLTYASDRLKAIAGVAKFIDGLNRIHGEPVEYLAGLWHNEKFGMQLCWVYQQPSLSHAGLMKLLQDREQYIAPSWSWASRDAGVDWLGYGTRTMFKVIRTDLRASHKSAMVSLAFGSSITISGKFRQAPVGPSSGRLVTDSHGLSHRWEVSSTYGRTDLWLDWVPDKRNAQESEFERQICLLWTTVLTGQCLGGLIIAPVYDSGGTILFYHRVGAFKHYGGISMLRSLPEQELTIR